MHDRRVGEGATATTIHAAPMSAFIGREEEKAGLAALVDAHRLVTVTGPGGMGKTRLATEVVADLAARFDGGVRRCELAPLRDDADLDAALAGQLGYSALDDLVDAAGDRRMVLLLDNCEHLLPRLARLVEHLLGAADRFHVLATSRERLGVDGERVLVLGPLALPRIDEPATVPDAPAVALFRDRAVAAGAAWEPSREHLAALAELCHRLDGVPLALELAASRARTMTPAEMLARLDRRLDLLRRPGAPAAARHDSLRAAVDTSYDLLSEAEQGFFRRLAVFAGPFPAELAHDVCAPAESDLLDTLDLLSQLVDRSVVTSCAADGRTRYALLETLRDYAAERLREAGEWDDAHERFVERLAAEADRLVLEALTRWTPDLVTTALALYRSIVTAIDWCVAHDPTAERAFRLVLPLWGALSQSLAGEAAAVGIRVLERWPEGDEPFRAEVMAVVANASLTAGRLETAVDLGLRSIDRPGASQIAQLLAERVLAFAARNAGDLDAAQARFDRARELAESLGVGPFERDLAVYGAWVAESDPERALAVVERARAEAETRGERINVVRADIVGGYLHLVAGALDRARAEVDRACAQADELDYPWGRGASRRLQAVLAAGAGELDRAGERWAESLDVFVPHGDLDEGTIVLRAAATRAMAAGDGDTAARLLAAAPRAPIPAPGAGTSDGLAVLARAARLVDVPMALFDAFALACRVFTGDVVAAPSAPAASPASSPAAVDAVASLRRTGDGWIATWNGESALVRHLKGLDDLAVLLARPDHEVHCLELMGAADTGGGAPVLDDQARRSYERRIRELQEELDEAQAGSDLGRAAKAEAELDALVQHLTSALGLGGRSRSTGSAAERARSAVAWRLRNAVKRVEDAHPALGRHLRNAVRTGTWCVYRPETAVRWEVDTGRLAQGRTS